MKSDMTSLSGDWVDRARCLFVLIPRCLPTRMVLPCALQGVGPSLGPGPRRLAHPLRLHLPLPCHTGSRISPPSSLPKHGSPILQGELASCPPESPPGPSCLCSRPPKHLAWITDVLPVPRACLSAGSALSQRQVLKEGALISLQSPAAD